jgi:uncharacterized protein YecT (DUF1311 family)
MLNQHALGTYPLIVIALFCIGAAPASDGNMCAIEKAVIHNMQPGGVKIPPTINHIAIEDGYALAGWINGYAGGVAVLRERSNGWIILSNSGGWNSTRGLREDGVPSKTAEKLAKDFGMLESYDQCCGGDSNRSAQDQACLDKAKTQRAMNICGSEELKRTYSELHRAYGEALSSTKSDPIALAKVVKANRAWEAYRDAYVDAMYPARDKQANYGSIYPLGASMLRVRLARLQIRALTCLRLGPSSLITSKTPCPY